MDGAAVVGRESGERARGGGGRRSIGERGGDTRACQPADDLGGPDLATCQASASPMEWGGRGGAGRARRAAAAGRLRRLRGRASEESAGARTERERARATRGDHTPARAPLHLPCAGEGGLSPLCSGPGREAQGVCDHRAPCVREGTRGGVRTRERDARASRLLAPHQCHSAQPPPSPSIFMATLAPARTGSAPLVTETLPADPSADQASQPVPVVTDVGTVYVDGERGG